MKKAYNKELKSSVQRFVFGTARTETSCMYVQFKQSLIEETMERKGLIFILVGPSGVGKNTVLSHVLEHIPNLVQMPTGTSRPRRPDETEKQHFFFSDEEFERLLQEDAFIEWQVVHGKKYGTMRSVIEQGIASGLDYIADVEVLGAFALKEAYPDNVLLIFIRPVSMDVLEQRIRHRSGDISDEELALRLGRARFEMPFMPKCDYIVVNDILEDTTERLQAIVLAERSRRDLINARVSAGYLRRIFHIATTGIILSEDRTRVLLVKGEKGKKKGWWLPPGGHVEIGEYPHDAVVREIAEKTGLLCEIVGQDERDGLWFNTVAVVPQPYWVLTEELGSHSHLDYLYLCKVTGEVEGKKPSGEFQWFRLTEVEGLSTSEDIKYVIDKLLQKDAVG